MKLPRVLTACRCGHRATSALARWVLAGLCLGIGVAAGAATETTVDSATLSALRAAETRMDQLAGLQRQATQTREEAQSLGREGEAAARAWENYRQADETAQVAIQRAIDCLAGLKTELGASDTAIAALERLLARSHSAVKTVALASANELALAARAADVAFQQRSESEQALASQQHRLKNGALDCARLISDANWDARNAHGSAQQFVRQAKRLPSQLQTLRSHWLETSRAFSAATNAQWRNHRATPVVLPEGEHVLRLQRTLSDLNLSVQLTNADASILQALARDDANFQRMATDLSRLLDAVAYIDLVTGPQAQACQDDGCPSLAVERRELARRSIDARTALQQTRRRIQDLAASLDGLLQPVQASLWANRSALTPVAAALGPAVDEVASASRTVQLAAESLEQEATTAYRQARREWEAAYRLAYGHAPPTGMSQSVEVGAAFPLYHMANGEVSAMRVPDLRSHAYELFNTLDAEPEGFGAYTYVLLRSAIDLETPAVRRRFRQLLSRLEKLPEAGEVPPELAPHVNVFCIPGSRVVGIAGGPTDIDYDSSLGNQLLLHALSGLLTRKEVSQRLTNSPGPFLITLPGRIADATSSWPLLFADLSGYPDEAVADLVNHYMNGLVDDFPSQQALWKPPVLQRVALLMIRLASGPGEVITSLMPTAAAEPP